jgi:2-dehydro-3-deoxygluconokinase
LAVVDGELHRQPALQVRAVDPVGAGDACGAFAVTVSGNWEGLPTREELDLLRHGDGTVLR